MLIGRMRRWKDGRQSRNGRMSQRSTATDGKSIAADSIRRRSPLEISRRRRWLVGRLAIVRRPSRDGHRETDEHASAAHLTPAILTVSRMTPDHATRTAGDLSGSYEFASHTIFTLAATCSQ